MIKEDLIEKNIEKIFYSEFNLFKGEDSKDIDGFVVDSYSSADWCFRMIKHFEEEKSRIEEYIKKEKDRYDTFGKKEIDKLDRSINHFKILIQNYVDKEKEKNNKFKLKTLNGSASYGKQQIKFKFDEKDILEYCKNNNLSEFINTSQVESINKNKFRSYLTVTDDNRAVTKDGEIVDKVDVEIFSNFNIKIN